MKVMIVDDEQNARERVERMLTSMQDIDVVAQARNGLEALHILEEKPADVVLLDIRMPKMDGLEAARHITALPDAPAVIFVTAYDEHALQAFETRALDYLVKPIRRERLEEALSRVKPLSAQNIDQIVGQQARQHICARYKGDLQIIPVEDIHYFQSDQKYVTVHYSKGQVLIEESLKQLEQEFAEDVLRTHRNSLVFRRCIDGLEKDSEGHAWLILRGIEDKIPVSRRHLPEVRKWLKQSR